MDDKMQLHDPEPLGASSLKARVDQIGRVISVLATPQTSNIEGFETERAFEIETPDQIFRFSIDARSAVFLEGALQSHRLFQASTEGGTLSSDALNPKEAKA